MLAPLYVRASFRSQGLPLCAPRQNESEHATFVCKLSVSSLYLARNQAYRGTCAIVYGLAHVTRPSELSSEQWQQYCRAPLGGGIGGESCVATRSRQSGVFGQYSSAPARGHHSALYRTDPPLGSPDLDNIPRGNGPGAAHGRRI